MLQSKAKQVEGKGREGPGGCLGMEIFGQNWLVKTLLFLSHVEATREPEEVSKLPPAWHFCL